MFYLKDFQISAVDELNDRFLELWKTGNYQIPIVFKAATGAGKTIMMANFLMQLNNDVRFKSQDKCYVWISFSEDSAMQSKQKLLDYSDEGTNLFLKDISNLSERKLRSNNVFFINWQKIKTSDKEGRKLRKPNEHTEGEYGIFDEFILKTKKDNREIVLIIDEAHTETDTVLYDEILSLLNPRIILRVTATPKNLPNISDVTQKKAGFVEVLEKDVIKSGLIKEKIVLQTGEEIKKLQTKGLNENEVMLELAFNKRLELKKLYEELGLDINPLVLIQLPSDFKEKEEVQKDIKSIVLTYLHKKKNIKDSEIGIWLSKEKKNLEFITKNNDDVNFLIFKVAPATGWDCPRADVLVMFREIGSPSFHTQIIGRIKRMPEANHYEKSELNKAYIYTNYNKDHIKNIKDITDKNKQQIHYTKLKDNIKRIKLETTFHHRTDFNTLSTPDMWQKSFFISLDKYFKTERKLVTDYSKNIKLLKNKINLYSENVNHQIVVDAEIESYDNFAKEIQKQAKNIEYHFSALDVERLYNLLCYDELKKQDKDEAKYNPSRSWGQLKSALNVWFRGRTGYDSGKFYKIIVNELLNPNSELKKAIHKALVDFRETYNIEIKEKQEKDIFDIEIPEKEVSFTDDFHKLDGTITEDGILNTGELKISITKNVYEDFYIRKQYKGKDNETDFIKFIETCDIQWWHKQDDSGRDVFAVEYYDTQEQKKRLFYPDFIIKNKSKIYIIDTKSGNTAKSQETADKNKALQQWIKNKKDKYDFEIIGGIAIPKHPNWIINKQENYLYQNDNDWEVLNFL
ncbi:MAG: restriction endonuclease subunit R [Gammaproteobacteria bacterium]|nr:MAG: restriction endonuclease subunit R [Gammaproteobacteria bacterium]